MEPVVGGPAWKSPMLFGFKATLAELTARFGPPLAEGVDSNGLGLVDEWCVRFPCGLEVGLWLLQIDKTGATLGPHELRSVGVFANSRERKHLCFHLGVADREVGLGEPDPTVVGANTWRVMRQDDNGRRFEVAAFTSNCEATQVAKEFEERGHKQAYYVEPM